jgi:hypothetical protein
VPRTAGTMVSQPHRFRLTEFTPSGKVPRNPDPKGPVSLNLDEAGERFH